MPDAMRSTCISGTGPQGNPQCLSTSPNSSLLEIYMDLGGLTLYNAGIETGACQHVTVVSVYDNRSVISSDVHCRENTTLTCHSDCPYIYEQNRCPVSEALGKFSMTFWLFAFMYFISNIVFAPIANLIDALTYSHLGEERGKWGPQRVWGTIGFALFGVAAGFAMDAVKRKTGDINYAWCFGFFILHNLLAALSAYFYKTSDDVKCSQPMKKLGQLLKNLEVISLYVLVFALGIFTGIIEALRFWHLQNLGASQLLLGLCLVMQCLPEIVVMFVMGYIIKLLGYHLCLYAACIAYACRFLGYSFLRNPWYVLLIEPLHGLTYAVMYGAASAYGSRLTPEGMHGTMQAMLTTLHFGFGELCPILYSIHPAHITINLMHLLQFEDRLAQFKRVGNVVAECYLISSDTAANALAANVIESSKYIMQTRNDGLAFVFPRAKLRHLSGMLVKNDIRTKGIYAFVQNTEGVNVKLSTFITYLPHDIFPLSLQVLVSALFQVDQCSNIMVEPTLSKVVRD